MLTSLALKMIKNYYNALINAGNDLKGDHENFIATFAPKRDDGTDLFNLLLTLIPIPINTAAARFFGGGNLSCRSIFK